MKIRPCFRTSVVLEYLNIRFLFSNNIGVLLATEHVVSHLKEMSKQVTTPEEIAQVCLGRYRYIQ
jgi:hypothetical protein